MNFEQVFTISETEVIKLLLAAVAGGLIGIEREFRDKAAGFRTNILICMGATLFTMFSTGIGGNDDPVRIAANIVSGVGFLGAGAILRSGEKVVGLTTASTIWMTAALGMGIGGGFYEVVAVATIAILVVLWVFPTFEQWIDNRRELRTYTITYPRDSEHTQALNALFQQSRLKIYETKQFKQGDQSVSQWVAFGSPVEHQHIAAELLADDTIVNLTY